jgi:hypothetical protein
MATSPCKPTDRRIRGPHSFPGPSVLLTALMVLTLAAFAHQVVQGQCGTFSPPACPGSGTNPCTYNTCRQVGDVCEGGITPVWSVVIGKPSCWPRCDTVSWRPNATCSESMSGCGTTIHYALEGCLGACTATGQWYGCKATGWGSGCANPCP